MRVGHKGRVTIPADLRRMLDIEIGDEVVFAPARTKNALLLWKEIEEEVDNETGEVTSDST